MNSALKIKPVTQVLILSLFIMLAWFGLGPARADAACTAPATDYGTATKTITVPTTGSYRVWSRIKAPDSTNNSYLLEIDGGTCVTVGDSAITANTWTWVDYQSGSTTTKTNATLSAGNHSIKMIGREPGVQLDRIVLTTDTTCVPTGNGDNCASPPDTIAPSVNLTGPANGSTVNGTVSITATASDDIAVSRVDFFVDSVLVGSDSSSPFSYSWNSTTVSDGAHSLVARAYDGAGNNTTSSAINVSVSNNKPDLVVTAVTWTPASPNNGDSVTFSATIRNQGTAATVSGVVHGVAFSVDGTVVNWSTNSTSSLAVGASRTVTATGGSSGSSWLATSGNHTILANVDYSGLITESNESNNTLNTSMAVNSPDITAPTVSLTTPIAASIVSGTTVAITASASDSGGSNLSRVEFMIDGTLVGTDSTSPYSYNWDTTTYSNATHSLTARAYDGAGNTTLSSVLYVTVNNVVQPPPIKTGDVNSDGKIDVFDLSIVLSNWNRTGAIRANGDVNGDTVVNVFDLSIILSNWGR